MKPSSIVTPEERKGNRQRKLSAVPWRVVSADGYDVAQFHGDFDPEHALQNAKLIINAPELLKVAEDALRYLERTDESSDPSIVERLQTVIAAATGRRKKVVS